VQQELLNYEAVVQYAGIADNDLLYFSYTNQVRRVSLSTGARPDMLSSRACQSGGMQGQRPPPYIVALGTTTPLFP